MSSNTLKYQIELAGLVEEKSKQSAHLQKINDRIEFLSNKIEFPKLVAKHEGKYYKYRNSYSCPEKPSDYWWVYCRVDKVINRHTFKGFLFETDKYGKSECSSDIGSHLFQKQISKKEYLNALKKFKSRIP